MLLYWSFCVNSGHTDDSVAVMLASSCFLKQLSDASRNNINESSETESKLLKNWAERC